MTLTLTKTDVASGEDHYWFVQCETDGSNPTVIGETYTFPSAKTNQEMEDVIVPNLTELGYTDLSPVIWE